MKANELRIGNYISRPDLGTGNQITEQILELLSKRAVTTGPCRVIVLYEDLKPIPLTEEWLLKMGYDLITESHYALSGHLIWKCNDLFMCDKNGIILKHVHQLQNLYFALTGEELEIK